VLLLKQSNQNQVHDVVNLSLYFQKRMNLTLVFCSLMLHVAAVAGSSPNPGRRYEVQMRRADESTELRADAPVFVPAGPVNNTEPESTPASQNLLQEDVEPIRALHIGAVAAVISQFLPRPDAENVLAAFQRTDAVTGETIPGGLLEPRVRRVFEKRVWPYDDITTWRVTRHDQRRESILKPCDTKNRWEATTKDPVTQYPDSLAYRSDGYWYFTDSHITLGRRGGPRILRTQCLHAEFRYDGEVSLFSNPSGSNIDMRGGLRGGVPSIGYTFTPGM